MNRLLLLLTLAVCLAVPAVASGEVNQPNGDQPNGSAMPTVWHSNSFVSPTGNIHCHYWSAPDNEVTCMTLNTGLTLYLTRYLSAGSRYAYLSNGNGPTLQYGDYWIAPGGFRCDSAFNGMTCSSRSGHGFFVNRTSFRKW